VNSSERSHDSSVEPTEFAQTGTEVDVPGSAPVLKVNGKVTTDKKLSLPVGMLIGMNLLTRTDRRRAVLFELLQAGHALTPTEIAQRIERRGHHMNPDQAKRVADILRHQVSRGWVRRVERGYYRISPAFMSRSTLYRIQHWERLSTSRGIQHLFPIPPGLEAWVGGGVSELGHLSDRFEVHQAAPLQSEF
jgi:hypothetical protein